MLLSLPRGGRSGGGTLQLHAPEAVLGPRLRDQNAVKTDNLKDFLHMSIGPGHSEGVARLAGISVERNEGGKTSGVNALHRTEVERQFFKEALLLTSDELLDPQDDVPD